MTENEIKKKIEEAILSNRPNLRGVVLSALASDIFKTLNEGGVMRVTKQKLLKMEMLVVVNDDFEDMDHEVHDALKVIENVESVPAIRVVATIPLDDDHEFNGGPLYDDGAIWHEMLQLNHTEKR